MDSQSSSPPPPYPSVITTALIVVSTVFPVISFTSIVLRMMARSRTVNKGFFADDYWIMASWLLSLGLSILVWIYAAKSGIDEYDVDLTTGTEASLELVMISSYYVQLPLAAVKISVLLFYKRIFITPVFRACVWVAIVIVSLWGVLFFFLVLFVDDPVTFPLLTDKLRYDATAVGLAQVVSSFVLDLLVLCLPIPVIHSLNMSSRQKIVVGLIFWLGAFCTVSAIVRTVLLDQSVRNVVSSRYQVANQSKQYIFMLLEPNCSILAACLPTYRPLLNGGRDLMSVIGGVRSVFSLNSNRSSRRGQEKAREASPNSLLAAGSCESYPRAQQNDDWQGANCRDVSASRDMPSSRPDTEHQAGIIITRGVHVRSQGCNDAVSV